VIARKPSAGCRLSVEVDLFEDRAERGCRSDDQVRRVGDRVAGAEVDRGRAVVHVDDDRLDGHGGEERA
jgi:hypothetical protein